MTKQRTIDMVVIFLGVIGVVALLTAAFLAWEKLAIPPELWGVVSGVTVGLPSLLASTRSGDTADPAQNVQVVNPPADPIPVAPVADPSPVPA